jgi:ParB family transcriptional regulator, chromosome partitioning protein
MNTDEHTAHHEPAAGQPGTAEGTGQPDSREPGQALPARAMIAVSELAAHPGNVRADLDLNEDFLASIAANGVLTPLRITLDGDGYRVIDGGRRLAAAVKTGTELVPYDLVAERAGDEAGQFLDMITTNRHRNPLTVLEEADALFAAHQAGARKTRLRKETGMSAAAVSHALAAARLGEDTRSKVSELAEQLTLDQYAVLAEFQDDPEAVEQLTAVARWGASLDHEAERLRRKRAEQAAHQRLRAELTAAGYTLGDRCPAQGQVLTTLLHDGQDLTPELHASCPGRGVFFRSWDLAAPVHYCADPTAYGHTAVSASPPDAPGPDRGGDPDPGRSPADAPPDPSRRIVIEGNKAWAAAAQVRRRWLTSLFARRTGPRELAQFITAQVVMMPEPLWSGLGRAHGQPLFAQITGRMAQEWADACGTVPAARLPLIMFAPVATAYEYAMTEAEGRHTWRTDRYSPCPRRQAAAYLTLLASLGYQLSSIEQAVAALRPYTGETPPGDPAGSEPASGDQDATGPDPETGDGPGGPATSGLGEAA